MMQTLRLVMRPELRLSSLQILTMRLLVQPLAQLEDEIDLIALTPRHRRRMMLPTHARPIASPHRRRTPHEDRHHRSQSAPP